MRPRKLNSRVTTLAIEDLGAWGHLLGEHAYGRDERALAYAPDTELIIRVMPGMEDEMNEYIKYMDSIQIGPNIYPVHGSDLLSALRQSKTHRRHIKWRMEKGAKLRFFDATQEHLRFAKAYLGVKEWGKTTTSCHPSKRYLTSKVETRRLLHRLKLDNEVLPWLTVQFGDYPLEVVARRAAARIQFLLNQAEQRGLMDVVDCVIIKHPELASSEGIRKVEGYDDILAFLHQYEQFRCEELILEVGISVHTSTSAQTQITRSGYEILGYSTQRIERTKEGFEYRGNTMVTHDQSQILKPCVQLQMDSLSDSICRELQRKGVRGYAVIDFLVDGKDQVWPLEVNLRVTATVYLRSLMEQVDPRNKGRETAGVIRNVDIPDQGAKNVNDALQRLDNLAHDGVSGVYFSMIGTWSTDHPTLCLMSTADSVSRAERMADDAAYRLTAPIQDVEELLQTRPMARADIPFKQSLAPHGA